MEMPASSGDATHNAEEEEQSWQLIVPLLCCCDVTSDTLRAPSPSGGWA